ncbi:TMEM175 family protein [Jatrophihabitans sp. DSM 45814]
MSEESSTVESGAAERLIFFSDAVVAIAITLLALELPIPTGATAHALWSSFRENDDEYLAFLLSFTVIAAAWSQHHHAFRYAERSDPRLRTLNMIWLLTIVLNPFAMKLLTSESHDTLEAHALRYGFYSLLQVLASATFLLMVHHMISKHLQSADAPPSLITNANWHAFSLILGFGLSIPVFFVTTHGWLLWIVIPLLTVQIRRYRRRKSTVVAASE